MSEVVKKMKQGSNEWLSWRRKHVGASDQLHLHWSAPWSIGWGALWDIKMGHSPEAFLNPQMERGVNLEEEARMAYSIYAGEEFEPALVECQEYPYLSASLDARSSTGAIAEIKCPGKEDHALAVRGEIPNKYLPQLCHQLFVTGASCVDYVSFDGNKIAVVRYGRDEELISQVMAAAHKFWVHVAEEKRPDGEWPLPQFDTRIPVIRESALVNEAFRNATLRDQIALLEKQLEDSNTRLLEGCALPRAKIGGIQIITTERKGVVDYTKIPNLSGVDLEPYRKVGTAFRSLRRIKEDSK